MGLQSISQPICQTGIRLRSLSGNAPGVEVWNINGVRWAGLTVTVGAGMDYASIDSALSGTSADVLILVYPTSAPDVTVYVGNIIQTISRNVYIRGLGISYDDIRIQGMWFLDFDDGVSFICEWLDCRPSSGTFLYVQYGSSPASVIFSKGIFAGSYPYQPANNFTPIELRFRYAKVYNNVDYGWDIFATSYTYNLSSTYMEKVWHPTSTEGVWAFYRCGGSLALDTTSHTTPTAGVPSGYGPDEGTSLITKGVIPPDLQAVSQPIGQTGIRLRRNSSNNPIDDGTMTTSQPISHTGIKLRRNFGNVPGE
jgi:hypothetical protein